MNDSDIAVGFDLGETLLGYEGVGLNWRSHYPRALTEVGHACGRSVSADDLSSAEAILLRYNTRESPRLEEVSAEAIFSAILRGWSVPDRFLPDAIDAFFAFFRRKSFRYPDVDGCLKALRSIRVPVGVLTDVPYGMPKRFVQQDLASAGLAGMFDCVLTSVDVGFRKPHAKGFMALAKALNRAPARMIYVGNEKKDVEGARSAGLVAVLLDREGGAEYGQHHALSTLAELHTVVLHEQRQATRGAAEGAAAAMGPKPSST